MTKPNTSKPDAIEMRLAASLLPFASRLADRIATLRAAFAEDYDGRQLSCRAIATLIEFLESTPSLPYPDLTATPAGDIYAGWRRPEGHALTIEFMDSGDARFLAFRPNPRHPERIDRFSGLTTADALGDAMPSLSHLTGLAA